MTTSRTSRSVRVLDDLDHPHGSLILSSSKLLRPISLHLPEQLQGQNGFVNWSGAGITDPRLLTGSGESPFMKWRTRLLFNLPLRLELQLPMGQRENGQQIPNSTQFGLDISRASTTLGETAWSRSRVSRGRCVSEFRGKDQ